MAKKQDQYLQSRNGNWHYYRKVPRRVAKLDSRSPFVRKSLHTTNIHEARELRDRYAYADDRFWNALEFAADAKTASDVYEASLRMVPVHGQSRSVLDMPISLKNSELLDRMKLAGGVARAANDKYYAALATPGAKIPDENDPDIKAAAKAYMAVTGLVEKPKGSIRGAFDIYVNSITASQTAGKSESQKRIWFNGKKRSVENFINLYGDIELLQVTREQALGFKDFWQNRISAGKSGINNANKDITNMMVLFRSYADYLQEGDLKNPFQGLNFKEPRGKKKARRLSFSREWVQEHFLNTAKLANLNAEARAILLILIETGCRPAEIMNLESENIKLNDYIPHVQIRFTDDREIKTTQSERDIPLVGVALEAMRKFPNGFPRYRDKENSYSATVNKYIKEHGLAETPEHTVYCLRHLFEDRMKKAKFDYEMRALLAGHKLDRSEYGEGFDLEDKQIALQRMTLPFLPSVV